MDYAVKLTHSARPIESRSSKGSPIHLPIFENFITKIDTHLGFDLRKAQDLMGQSISVNS
jgi:hypothetical protein